MSAPQTTSAELHPADISRVAALTTGGFVNVWMAIGSDGTNDVFAQRYLASGVATGAVFRVNTTTAGDQGADNGPVVTGLANGRFVVTWIDQLGSFSTTSSIRAQIYDNTGARVGGELVIDSDVHTWVDPRVSATSDGGFIIGWEDRQGGALDPIYAAKFRVFDANGVAKTSEIGVSAADSSLEATTVLANGALVVAWNDDDAHVLRLKLYDAAGVARSSKDVLVASAVESATVSLASLANGGFVATWETQGPNSGVHIQRFDINGAKVGAEVVLQSATSIGSYALTGLADGGFMVAYTQPSGSTATVYARVYDADGSERGGALQLNTAPGDSDPELTFLTSGQAVVVWSGATQPYESLRFVDPGAPNIVIPQTLATAFGNLLREPFAAGASLTFENNLASQLNAGQITAAQAIQQIVARAGATTSVATLAYQFFTGKIPGGPGLDFLVSPTGANANNLNSAYYQDFNLENRYINFAVNLGKVGEGRAKFELSYGNLTLAQATKQAYATIFGGTPTDAKVAALLEPTVVIAGHSMTRAQYFEAYGGDGPNGIGTKAAMVGWLMGEAIKADIGMYAKANDAFLTDLADGATYNIDLVGVYGNASFIYAG